MSDFIVLTPTTKEEPKTKRFCYWTVADGKHGKMMETTIASARAAGVKEDFHVWSDQQIEGAINHDCGKFDKTHYLFKFKFLREQVQKLDYDYFIFLDADNYFVRHPGDILSIMGKAPVFVCMENDCGSDKVKRGDWWSCPIKEWPVVLKKYGVKTPKFYNTNAGFWIVKKSVIEQFYSLAMMFWEKCHKEHGYKGFTEEPALAYVGHMLAGDEQENQTLDKTSHIWASDWAHYYSNVIPDGKPWTFEDYMTGEKKTVNPAIVHAMRSKDVMIAMTEERRAAKGVAVSVDVSQGFWMGHQMLGDVFGFCAAAHLLYKKTGQIIKIHYPQEDRKGIVTYFTGVRWVKKEEIPNAINCGGDPSISQWPTMNGVKRFYRFMDPTLKPTLTFDVHMNVEKYKNPKEKLIGLVSHSVTQGDIPETAVLDMCKQALVSYPGHKIVLLGEKKNNFNFPKDVAIEDRRDSSPDFDSLVEQTRNLSVLLCPQTGPCFVAAGLKVPMWVYRSKQPHWDCVLNYETYKVERWFDRPIEKGFKDYKNYLLGCSGIGDMSVALSALESIGIENNKEVFVYVDKAKQEKLFNLHSLFALTKVKILTEHPGPADLTGANAHGMDCTWTYDWPKTWGVTKRLGSEYMMRPKHFQWKNKKGTVGVSFTVNFAKHKNPSDESKSQIINKLLVQGKKVIYFGKITSNNPDDKWLSEFTGKIEFAEKNLFLTSSKMCDCEYFIGADSGMAWLSTFFRIPTKVVIGRTYGEEMPKTFANIKNCEMLWEDDFLKSF